MNAKFKFWSKHMETWLDPHMLAVTGGGDVWSTDGHEYVRDVAVCRFTGMKDKNGEEIYEGDVICDPESDPDDPFTGRVEFCEYGKWVILPDNEDLCEYSAYAEIVGNIYENPAKKEDKNT